MVNGRSNNHAVPEGVSERYFDGPKLVFTNREEDDIDPIVEAGKRGDKAAAAKYIQARGLAVVLRLYARGQELDRNNRRWNPHRFQGKS